MEKQLEKDNTPIISVKDLKVSFFTPVGEVKAVDGVSYDLNKGEVLGIVGESGSGKSVSVYTLMGLLANPGKVVGGEVIFEGKELFEFTEAQKEEMRGNDISMIFQNPMTCLNPVYTVGNQLSEALTTHGIVDKEEVKERVLRVLEQVGINNPEKRIKQYPHELSGGMRQRVMIAMGLICNPKILIADEPTTALDVTIQAQILELMKELIKKNDMSVIFITHNLGVVAEICNRVAVMYGGKIVEQGTVEEVFYNPSHPYTIGLLESMPRIDANEYERLIPIEGTPIDLLNPPLGCGFAARCKKCMKICLKAEPPMVELKNKHTSKCWLLTLEDKEEN